MRTAYYTAIRNMQETAHLMRSARNAARLDRAVRDLEQGKGVRFDPFEPLSELPLKTPSKAPKR